MCFGIKILAWAWVRNQVILCHGTPRHGILAWAWGKNWNSPCHGTLRSLGFILSQALNGPWSFCHGVLGLRTPCFRPWVTLSWPLGSLRSNCPKLEFLKMLLMLPSFLTDPFFGIFFFWGLGFWGLLANLLIVPTCLPIYATYPPTYLPT